ncbi:hypothetical protein VPH35_055644 [Triticum aestivum]|uniref:tyrosyl-DNA phosphodiesterase 2-like n=1 Tax=Triticum aestivum TaxID=4565 RepID=UPI0008432AD9|nr:tyrosyl-DNA phosphodiesterase 2-like [Triticum aestivum]
MDGEKGIKFMTYNVWSREDVAVYTRMKAIGDLVRDDSPDVIFFQEVTPYIQSIFESFPWWEEYNSSPVPPEEQTGNHHFCLMLSKLPMERYARWKFATSPTGKCYLEADITPRNMYPIRIATTHLECPVPPASMHLRDRYMQAKHVVSALSSAGNVVFGGDMSWDDDADLPFPLPEGWGDAWVKLGRSTALSHSWTYSSFWVEKPREFNGHKFPSYSGKRSDRFVCKLQDYTVKTIGRIGGDNLGIYCTKDSVESLPIMPSCHRGLVLTIVPNELL